MVVPKVEKVTLETGLVLNIYKKSRVWSLYYTYTFNNEDNKDKKDNEDNVNKENNNGKDFEAFL